MTMEEEDVAKTTKLSETHPKSFQNLQSCSPLLSSDTNNKSPVTETSPPAQQEMTDSGLHASTETQQEPTLRSRGSTGSHNHNHSLLRASNASTNPRSTRHLSSEFSDGIGGESYKLSVQAKSRDSAKGRKRKTNNSEKQDIAFVYHAPEYRHKVNIVGKPSRYTLDKSRKLTVEHQGIVKRPRLKSLTTGIQVMPDIELDEQRKTALILTLALGSPHPDYLYFAETEAILWDYSNLKELGKTRQRNDFNTGHNQKTFSVTLADREKVEGNSSKSLEVIVRVTLCGYPRGQLTEEAEDVLDLLK